MTWRPGALLRLSTESYVLRSIEREDVTEGFLAWLADPEVALGLNLSGRRMTRAQGVRWALNFDNDARMLLLVFDAEAGAPIGFYQATFDNGNRVAETSVVLGDKAYWGKGVVKETRSAILDFLFDVRDAHKVIGRPHGRNFSSIFNYKAMGFVCEAVLKEQMRAIEGDGRLDQLIFGMLKRDWLARRATET